jgi:hypothetical protein
VLYVGQCVGDNMYYIGQCGGDYIACYICRSVFLS